MQKLPLVLTLVAILIMQNQRTSLPSTDDVKPGNRNVEILPAITLNQKAKMEIRFEFRNSSQNPVRYIFYYKAQPVGFLHFSLHRNGQRIEQLETPEGPLLIKRNVRQLEPAKSLTHTINITEMWGKLKPGLYVLHVDYQIRTDAV